MDLIDGFWRRFSTANGSGAQLVLDRRHPYKDDLHVLQAELIKYALDNGYINNVYILCDMAERYGKTIGIIHNFEVTGYLMMVHNMLKAELGIPYTEKTDHEFERMYKAFVGVSVLTHAIDFLSNKGWKRFVEK